MSDARSASYRRAMREHGYADGRAGKPAKWADAHYQHAWRRGREARAEAGKVAP